MNKSWPMVKLGEVVRPVTRSVEVIAGQSYRTIGVKWWGEGAYERETIDGSRTVAKTLSLVKQGDLIINKIWVRNGSTAIADAKVDGCVASGEFPTFELNPDLVIPEWIHWQTKTRGFWTKCDLLSQGSSGKNRIKPDLFLTIQIPLPSLSEQRRVVARIEELSAQILEARKLRIEAAEEADVLLYLALRSIRHDLLAGVSHREKIGEVTKVTSGGTPSRENPAFWNGSIPWIKTGELEDNDIFSSEERITEYGLSSSSARRFPADTILIALYGQGQTRGRTARLMIPAATNQACCAILPNNERFDSQYLQYWLRSQYHELREEAQGGAQPNWNGGMIKDLDIALPSLPEQRRIVAELDALQAEVDALKRLQAATSAELDALLPSILDRAFKGGL